MGRKNKCTRDDSDDDDDDNSDDDMPSMSSAPLAPRGPHEETEKDWRPRGSATSSRTACQESLCPFTPNVLNQLRQNPGLKPVVESFTLQFAPNNGSIQGGSLCCTGTGERNRRTLAQLRHHAQDQAGGGAGPGGRGYGGQYSGNGGGGRDYGGRGWSHYGNSAVELWRPEKGVPRALG